MAAQRGPTVVVPLLLSTGYHTNHDLPEMAKAAARARCASPGRSVRTRCSPP